MAYALPQGWVRLKAHERYCLLAVQKWQRGPCVGWGKHGSKAGGKAGKLLSSRGTDSLRCFGRASARKARPGTFPRFKEQGSQLKWTDRKPADATGKQRTWKEILRTTQTQSLPQNLWLRIYWQIKPRSRKDSKKAIFHMEYKTTLNEKTPSKNVDLMLSVRV